MFYHSIEKWFGHGEIEKMTMEFIIVLSVIGLLSLGLGIKLIITKRSEIKKDQVINDTKKALEEENQRYKESEERIYTMAYFDELTQLGNKVTLYRDLKSIM